MATQDIRALQADELHNQMTAQRIGPGRFRSRLLRRMILAGCLGMVTFGSIGCTASSGIFRGVSQCDCLDEFMVNHRNRVKAEQAWHCRKDGFGANAKNDVYKAGFIAGYLDIADGGEGCIPLVAPQEYWGWRYQSAGGQSAAGGWFSGWPMGVQAAEEAGLGSFRQAPHCNSCNNTVPACGAGNVMPAEGVNPFYPDATMMGQPTAVPLETIDSTPAPPTDLPDGEPDMPTIDATDDAVPAVPKEPDAIDSVNVTTAPEATIASLPTDVDGVTTSFDDSTDTISIEEIFGLAPQEAATIESSETALPFSFE